jgi:hypothetical protein
MLELSDDFPREVLEKLSTVARALKDPLPKSYEQAERVREDLRMHVNDALCLLQSIPIQAFYRDGPRRKPEVKLLDKVSDPVEHKGPTLDDPHDLWIKALLDTMFKAWYQEPEKGNRDYTANEYEAMRKVHQLIVIAVAAEMAIHDGTPMPDMSKDDPLRKQSETDYRPETGNDPKPQKKVKPAGGRFRF